LNIGVTLMNKAFFQWFGFSFPIALSLVHMVCSALGSEIVLRTGAYDMAPLSMAEQLQLFLFSLLFSANIVVGNSALKYVPVSLVQVVRSVIPGLTLMLSMFVLGKKYSSSYYWTILLIVIGVALASAGEVEFHFVGFLLTVLVCFLSSLKSVVSQKFLVGKLNFHPFVLLQRMSWMSAAQMLVMSLLLEKTAMQDWWKVHDTDAIAGQGLDRVQFALLLLANGAMAFLLNYTNFMTTKKTSALTVTVAGNVKHMCTILFSVMMFKNPISLLNGAGTLVTLVGAVIYSMLEYNEKLRQKARAT
jgi:drug/metabolite transporter (DMT)-like permease